MNTLPLMTSDLQLAILLGKVDSNKITEAFNLMGKVSTMDNPWCYILEQGYLNIMDEDEEEVDGPGKTLTCNEHCGDCEYGKEMTHHDQYSFDELYNELVPVELKIRMLDL